MNLQHIDEVERSKSGIPLINSLFYKAQEYANSDLLCFVNADIIMTQGVMNAINIVRQKMEHFIMTSTPWNLFLDYNLNFNSLGWEEKLYNLAKTKGKAPRPIGVDVILFPKGFYKELPPFVVGKTSWDNWLIFKARLKKIPLIDTIPFVFIVHQEHANSTHNGPLVPTNETYVNQRLAGWWGRSFIAQDATYLLEGNGSLRRKSTFELLRPRIQSIKSYLISQPRRYISHLRKRL